MSEITNASINNVFLHQNIIKSCKYILSILVLYKPITFQSVKFLPVVAICGMTSLGKGMY